MREGLINVPKFDNDGNSLDALVEQVMTILSQKFGGATAIDVTGCWFGPDGKLYREPITQIITAYQPSSDADNVLRSIAVGAGMIAKQLAMYVRYASGEVEIIELKPEAKQAA